MASDNQVTDFFNVILFVRIYSVLIPHSPVIFFNAGTLIWACLFLPFFTLQYLLLQADSWAEAEDECDSIGGFLVEPNTQAKSETLVFCNLFENQSNGKMSAVSVY